MVTVNGVEVTETRLREQMQRHGLPEYMVSGMFLYLTRRIPPGGFLTSTLANDFMGAVSRADDENIQCLAEWARFIYNDLPSACHGSPEKVENWLLGKE
jgi:hypothetical protein